VPPKQIIALATHHHVQLKGHALNDRFGQVISLIREKYPVQIILEEWTPDRQSFASTVDTDGRMSGHPKRSALRLMRMA
jgi:hypothetical protein